MAARKNAATTAKTSGRKGGAPPKAHQFKPGQSGNPKGRPRKSESLKAGLREALDAELEVLEGGCPVRMTYRDALAKQVVRKAVQTGDPKLIRLLLEHDQPEPQVQKDAEMRAQQDAQACEAVLAVFRPTQSAVPLAIRENPTERSVEETPQKVDDIDEQLRLPFPEDR